ncbi:TonB-dependent receptor plug domain-containing protein [Brevundimonas sp.]|uniref:TonB-dependent receptor plug domain-containing protein n=1 Tax=Brevundimonas sp. TaxID=1871086 RepID=UPI003F7192DD
MLSLAVLALAQAQEPGDPAAHLSEIVVTGSRLPSRTATESPAPIDVLSREDLVSTGAVGDELGQAISVLAPSFNFPRQSNSGTSDHIRAGQLRGLSPDQTLVLVNGRRRHPSAIVNTETKIGRGTAAVDLNTIPLGAVARVEVLRDGAGAVYGSDAIAGVINVILDERPSGLEFSTSYGFHRTEVDPIDQTLTDGETFTLSASGGMALGDGGFLRGGVDYRDRNATNRAGFDQIPFFIAPTPANLALAGGRNYAEGDPAVEAVNLWINAAIPLAGGELYGFGTVGQSDSEGATFFRYPDGADNLTALYPNGFLPITTGEDDDLGLTTGWRTPIGPWAADFSLTYGRNEFTYGVRNSLNASLGAASPRQFRSGTYVFDQTSANLDLTRTIRLGGIDASLATGLEYRTENYETRAGETASYAAGGLPLAIGAQGAPGLSPEDERSASRDVGGAYLEIGLRPTDRLLVEAAVRAETYSDFGETLTGKLAGSYAVTPDIRLRGAVSNSVRAPFLGQIAFTDRTVNFGAGGTLASTRTLPVSDPIARALGAEDLREERAFNLSAGLTAEPLPGLTFSLDAFRIEVDDRITLSDRFFGPALEAFVQAQPSGAGLQSVRFFTNAVDTETDGFDAVAQWRFPLADGQLTLGAAYSYARTDIVGFTDTPAALTALDPTFRLIGVEEINTLEEAAPNWKALVSAEWSTERYRLLGRLNGYGSTVRVFNFGGGFEPRQEYGEETSLDLEGSVDLTSALTLTAGVSNALDNYPDRSSADINYFGNLPYDILSPVGINGRYLYTRLTARF